MVIVAELGRSRFANVGFGESAGQDSMIDVNTDNAGQFLVRVTDNNNSRVYLRRLRGREVVTWE